MDFSAIYHRQRLLQVEPLQCVVSEFPGFESPDGDAPLD